MNLENRTKRAGPNPRGPRWRDLENAIEHGFVLTSGPLIDFSHRPPRMTEATVPASPVTTFEDLERQLVGSALERNGYKRAAAARQLGIHKTTFFRKVKRLGIALPDSDGRTTWWEGNTRH